MIPELDWRIYSSEAEGIHVMAGPVADQERIIVCEHVLDGEHAKMIAAAPKMWDALMKLPRFDPDNCDGADYKDNARHFAAAMRLRDEIENDQEAYDAVPDLNL